MTPALHETNHPAAPRQAVSRPDEPELDRGAERRLLPRARRAVHGGVRMIRVAAPKQAPRGRQKDDAGGVPAFLDLPPCAVALTLQRPMRACQTMPGGHLDALPFPGPGERR